MVVSECHRYRWEAYNRRELKLGKQVGVREVFHVTFNHSSHKDLPSKGPGNWRVFEGLTCKLFGYQEK